MSLTHGIKSVNKTGLSFYVDAGNVKSYPGTGTLWYDISGNNGIGTLTSGPTFSSSNTGTLVFDGTDDFVDFPALPGSFASFSVIVWFYPTSVVDFKNVLDCNWVNYTSGNIGPRLEMNTAGALTWAYSNQTSNINAFYTHPVVNSGLQANIWHNVAITYNGTSNSSNTYYNGINTGLSRSVSGAPTGFVGSMARISVGKGFQNISQRSFAGRISVVQIYNKELSTTEINENFTLLRNRYIV